jgi:hypothetical protein
LHGAQHFDDGFLSLRNRILDEVYLIGELGEFCFGLRKLRFACLHPFAGVDQIVVQLRPLGGE